MLSAGVSWSAVSALPLVPSLFECPFILADDVGCCMLNMISKPKTKVTELPTSMHE